MLKPFMFIHLRQMDTTVIKDGFHSQCRSGGAFPELTAGKGQQHVSSCQTQLPVSEAIPWLSVVGGCNTAPKVAPSVGL